jgi:hypothetical protein
MVDKLARPLLGRKDSRYSLEVAKVAYGNASRAVFLKAVVRLQLSAESYLIAVAHFELGYPQATVARHAGVSRQRVHAVCQRILEEIKSLSEKKQNEKKNTRKPVAASVDRMRKQAIASTRRTSGN